MAESYTTNQGDTWDVIAYRLWHRESFMRHLLDANPDLVDTLVFGAGVVLNVPQDVKVEPAPMEMPPWMR